MSDYRIIQNALGFFAQRHSWYGWTTLSVGEYWWGGRMESQPSVEAARSLIDADIARRRQSTNYHDGAVVEYYSPKP